jgi:hypothetical protein
LNGLQLDRGSKQVPHAWTSDEWQPVTDGTSEPAPEKITSIM